jgi:hypothetical protein
MRKARYVVGGSIDRVDDPLDAGLAGDPSQLLPNQFVDWSVEENEITDAMLGCEIMRRNDPLA